MYGDEGANLIPRQWSRYADDHYVQLVWCLLESLVTEVTDLKPFQPCFAYLSLSFFSQTNFVEPLICHFCHFFHGLIILYKQTNIKNMPKRFRAQKQAMMEEQNPQLKKPYNRPTLGEIIRTFKAASTHLIRVSRGHNFA